MPPARVPSIIVHGGASADPAEGRDELRAGAGAAVSRVANPIALARRVMEHTPHVLLVGEGAHDFARAQGFPDCDPRALVTERQLRRHRERAAAAMKVASSATARRGRVGYAHSTPLMPVAIMAPAIAEPRLPF